LPPNAKVYEEDLKENLITVKVYSEKQVKTEHIELIDQFSKQITDHVALAHCQVILTFFTGNIDVVLENILKETYNLELEKIPLKLLLHLNQD